MLAFPTLRTLAAAAALALFAAAPSAHAADCKTDKKAADLSQDEAQALYDCIEASLLEGYSKATDVPGLDYRSYKLVSTAPLQSSTHGYMMVNHWVNDLGAELYTKWEDMDGAKFPIGTIFAKESFRVTKKGDVKRGPLFLMEKVEETGDAKDGWVYTRLFPNGKYQRTNGPKSEKMAFCHDCHAATIDDFDAAFFPPEEYRVSN